jgi:hypothetical protein
MLLQTNKGAFKMTDVRDIQITEISAFHFLQAIEDAILDGFYADHSIPGYPQVTTYPLQVRMFKGDKPALRFDLSAEVKEANIVEYDAVVFLLNFQSAVLQGFSVQDHGTMIDPVGVKAAVMRRSVQTDAVVLDLDEDVPQSVTEAPKPKAQTQRKPSKSKEA